jgi:hypothetical protein
MKHRIRCYDNGGETLDRFTVIYMDDFQYEPGIYSTRAMSVEPNSPSGFGQMCTAQPGRHLGLRVKLKDLPKACQDLVASDLRGSK